MARIAATSCVFLVILVGLVQLSTTLGWKLHQLCNKLTHVATVTTLTIGISSLGSPQALADQASKDIVSGDTASFGLVDGRLLKCKAKSNCISTSSISSVDKYARPWSFSSSKTPTEEFSTIESIIKGDSFLKLVESDPSKMYIHAEAKSAFPPDGIDDLEFLVIGPDHLITYRSNSRILVPLGTDIVGDGGANRNRLSSIQQKLGVAEMAMDDDTVRYIQKNNRMNFLDRLRAASEPNEVNFLDNSVPENE